MKIWELIKKYNVSPKKVLGQNFLIDQNVNEKIINAANVGKKDLIIEVGPGLGTLTAGLVESAGYVLAYEIDRDMVKILNEIFCDKSNLKVVHEDILKVDLISELKNYEGMNIKIIANLPYYITTHIIMNFLESNIRIDSMIFMIQKEVADRIVAKAGKKEYGALSIAVQYRSEANIVMNVSKGCFYPEPNVTSSVVKLNIYKKSLYNLKSEEVFFKIVKAAFAQRRKTLANALFNSQYLNKTKVEIEDVLIEEGFDKKIRGEKLSIMEFISIANAFL